MAIDRWEARIYWC